MIQRLFVITPIFLIVSCFLFSCLRQQAPQVSACKLDETIIRQLTESRPVPLPTAPTTLPKRTHASLQISTETVGRLELLTSLHLPPASLNDMAYSPDGMLLSVTRNLTEPLRSETYILAQDEQTQSIGLLGPRYAWTLTWLDAKTLARGIGMEIELWQLDVGARLCHSQDVADTVDDVEFSRAKDLLAIASSDKTVRLLRLTDGAIVKILRHEWPLTDAAFSPTGEWIATTTSDDKYMLWNTQTGQMLWSAEYAVGPVSAIAISPIGNLLAVGGWPIRLVDPTTGNIMRELSGSGPTVIQLGFTKAGDVIIASTRGKIVLWRVADGALLRELTFSNKANYFALHPDGTELAVGLENGEIQFWGVPQ